MICVATRNNYTRLLQLNFCIGVGISIVAATSLFDLLYLRMQFDLAWFGVLKSSMFFLPALTYFCAAPFLKGTTHSLEIVQWGYAIRIGAAVLIPFAALCTENRTALLICAATCTSVAYVAAAFANNTLMVLYRQLLPMAEFNRKNAKISMVLCVSTSTFFLLGAWLLSAAENFSNRNFYLLFSALALGTGVCEWMTFRIGRQLTMPAVNHPAKKHFSMAEYLQNTLAGLYSPRYRQLLFVTATVHFFAPLLDTYICVYLYKVHHTSVLIVALLNVIASYCANFAGVWLGKVCDKAGYLKLFRRMTLTMIVLTLLFGFLNGNIWVAAIFLLLIYNGSSGLLAGGLLILRSGAAAKLVPAEGGESYVAAYSMIQMLCSFTGSLAAGWIFSLCQFWTGTENADTFSLYFKIAGGAALLMLLPLYDRNARKLDC